MERRTQDEGFRDQRHEVPPSVEAYQQPARYGDGNDDRATQPPIGLRVRWGGVTSGWVIALGTILLLTALGLAIGITAIGDPRAADRETASGLGIGAGLWGAITLLIAYFLGGLMATRVTDRPDRGGALMHGALVWTLTSVFLIWLLGQGISLGTSSLFGALSGLTHTATTAVTATVTKGEDLAQSLGLTDPAQVINRLDNPETASLFASAVGMSAEEARATLAQFRDRIEAVRDNPEGVATEVRTFLAQYKERAEQQALRTAAAVQEGATVGSWVTFGILALTLVTSILGAVAGVPSLQNWRARWAHTGAA
jgi:hypothetical protein